jgi:Phosphoenolpyruvate phosphomutase
MSVTQAEKAACFRDLHDAAGTFVIPNPWDVGSARLLAGLGFPALATSSAAAKVSTPSSRPLGPRIRSRTTSSCLVLALPATTRKVYLPFPLAAFAGGASCHSSTPPTVWAC